MKNIRNLVLSLAILLSLTACSQLLLPNDSALAGKRATTSEVTLSGSNGSVVISGMSGSSLTVSYNAGKQLSSATLYLSEGNGTGLVLASKPMNYSAGVYTYTFSHATFTTGASIHVLVLKNDSGVETCIPQGPLGTTASWASVVYGSTGTVTPDPVTSPVTKIQAESYTIMSGIQTESCNDTDGGSDVGWIDAGDWMVYPVTLTSSGTYTIQYRIATPNNGAYLTADLAAGSVQLGRVDLPNTGDWQNWQTVTQTVTMNAGSYNFGINGGSGGFNINWFTIQYTGDQTPNPVGPAGYTYCAPENASFALPGTCDVAYGANGSFNYLYGKTGTITFNNATFGDPIVNVAKAGFYKSSAPAGNLIARNAGMKMTMQFQNSTGGQYSNDRIYVAVIFLNSNGQWCHLTPSGAQVVITDADNGALTLDGRGYTNFFYKLSDISGFQMPINMVSGRIWMSMDKPLYLRASNVNGTIVGMENPSMTNPTDPNRNIYFDWAEFSLDNSSTLWVNSTLVDMFGFPTTISVYEGSDTSYSLFQKVGITESRAAIYNAFNALPAPYNTLTQQYRIVAPHHGAMDSSNYWDSYRDAIWAQYTANDLVLDNEFGHFTGRVQSDQRLRFTRSGDSANVFYITKPSTSEIFGGDRALNSISPQYVNDQVLNKVEPRLGASICSAFHRHVMQNSAFWAVPLQYYLAEPYDHYAQFWHQHSIDSRAYGFCYDDVAGQDPTIVTGNARGMIIEIRW